MLKGDKKARTALVTGAASGIGQAIAEALEEKGFRVLRVDLKPLPGEDAIQADLSNPEEVRRAAEWALSRGGVDVLVNNAGFQHVAPLEEFPLEAWQKMLGLMLTAPFLLTRAFLPGMKERDWGASSTSARSIAKWRAPTRPPT